MCMRICTHNMYMCMCMCVCARAAQNLTRNGLGKIKMRGTGALPGADEILRLHQGGCVCRLCGVCYVLCAMCCVLPVCHVPCTLASYPSPRPCVKGRSDDRCPAGPAVRCDQACSPGAVLWGCLSVRRCVPHPAPQPSPCPSPSHPSPLTPHPSPLTPHPPHPSPLNPSPCIIQVMLVM